MGHVCEAESGGTALLPLEAALAAYAQQLHALPAATRPLTQALGQVLAAEVLSDTDLPLFTQSAVDGYAMRSADGSGPLRLAGEVAAGAALPAPELRGGEAVRIFTGGALPPGADTVARQEIVRREGDFIWLEKALPPGADTRHRGEELRRGASLAAPGQRLHAGLLAALAMAGVAEVSVRPRPRVAVLISGDEVAPNGAPLAQGRIHDANGPLIRAWLAERGYAVALLQHVPDTLDATTAALGLAAESADLIITTGGVSVGDHDHLPAAAERVGFRRVFWKVAQKPGKPIWFGVRGPVPLLALPGNPAAVLIGLHVHVIRALELLEGASDPAPRWRHGRLSGEFRCDRQRDTLVRVTLAYGEDGSVHLGRLPRQDSHMLSNLAQAAALAWLPTCEDPLPPGAAVRWIDLLAGS